MRRILALLRTTVGRKVLMAVTGVLLLGFLIVHLLGNLYVLQGREALNAYAAWLKANPLLWPARIGLLGLFGIHVWLGLSLAIENRKARPQGYRENVGRSLGNVGARSMARTGILILAFVLFHLAHFTLGVVDPETHAMVDAEGRHDVYGMVVASFSNPWITGTYVVAMGMLGLHLAHAGQSFLQTLGIRYAYGNQVVKNVGLAVVTIVTLGNLALPLLVFSGFAGSPESISSQPQIAQTDSVRAGGEEHR